MGSHRFVKMHGIGNDFVVLDARQSPLSLPAAGVQALADRRTGVGFDQLIILEPSQNADVFMRIHNADGSEAAACGNGARCVGAVVMQEKEADAALIETASGTISARDAGEQRVSIDMGKPGLDWRDIPLAEERNTLHIGLEKGPLTDPVGVSMGNPHAVFFVPDTAAIALGELGPALETDALFPERANIGVAQITGPESLRLRVWERGAGLTRACGTGACAALVAASRRGLTGRRADVHLDGGALDIDWRADDHVWMTGPVATSFIGETDPGLLV